jgi:hypothetical protein
MTRINHIGLYVLTIDGLYLTASGEKVNDVNDATWIEVDDLPTDLGGATAVLLSDITDDDTPECDGMVSIGNDAVGELSGATNSGSGSSG